MQLDEKHVLVTGAGKRIGRSIAESFLKFNIRLTAHSHTSGSQSQSLCDAAKASGCEAFSVQADLARPEEISHAVAQAMERFGPVEILVNSAGIFGPTNTLTCTPEEWDRFQDINLRGQFFFAQQVAKVLLQNKVAGTIVNVGDVNGERPIRSHIPYCVSKAGLLLLTRNLAKEWGPLIRVNSISPGAVLLPEHYSEIQKQKSIARSLLGRLGSPADIVAGVHLLIENDYMTGFDLKVDGGRSLV